VHLTYLQLSGGGCVSKFIVPFRMQKTGWLLLALCVLLGIELSGFRLGPLVGIVVAISLLLHEVGHMLAARMLRVPVHEFGMCLSGAYNRRAYAGSRRDEVLISAAGPLMNLLLVLPLLFVPMIGTQLALCNVLLCVGNLLPLPSSDGLRILRTIWTSIKTDHVIHARSRRGSVLPARIGYQSN
jgi:Zn-dependent protease